MTYKTYNMTRIIHLDVCDTFDMVILITYSFKGVASRLKSRSVGELLLRNHSILSQQFFSPF